MLVEMQSCAWPLSSHWLVYQGSWELLGMTATSTRFQAQATRILPEETVRDRLELCGM